jgi:two-component system, NtrC family, sensor histidine kinase HydH
MSRDPRAGTAEPSTDERFADVRSVHPSSGRESIAEREVLDSIDMAVIIADPGGAITFMNQTAAAMLGVDAADRDVTAPALLALPHGIAAMLGGEPALSFCHTVETAHGPLHLDVQLSRVDGDGRTQSYFFVFRDASLEREREEERQRFEKLVAVATMVAGFAHEIRNPVAALRSIAEELDEELSAAGLGLPHAHRMLQVLERIERLVKSSLQFGCPPDPNRRLHSPGSIVTLAISGVAPRVRATGDAIRVEVAPDLPRLSCDEEQVAQALVILLDNAIEATGRPSRVLLRACRGRGPEPGRARESQPPAAIEWVRFEVIDDGPGIAPDAQGRIFDPFFTTKPSGTGLGLSIAQQLVGKNKGRLEVRSQRGGPTTFVLSFPGR